MDDDHRNFPEATLAILTLRRHKDGVWIRRLVEAIQQHDSDSDDHDVHVSMMSARVIPEVVVVEDLLSTPFCLSSYDESFTGKVVSSSSSNSSLYSSFGRWKGLVNRVSDAAEPWEAKAAASILQLVKQVWKIPVWNGPDAYSLCSHKWCHHVLFARANLKSPDTVAVLRDIDGDKDKHDEAAMRSVQMLLDMQPPSKLKELQYLVKPNAGGFGAGIEKRTIRNKDLLPQTGGASTDGLAIPSQTMPNFSDRFTLFQRYSKPRNGKIYRVWFLLGQVQCAVERTVDLEEDGEPHQSPRQQQHETSSTSEFTSGCAGGMCQLSSNRTRDGHTMASPTSKPTSRPWAVPEDVVREIEQQLLPVLPDDAHCGSVEFLYVSQVDTTIINDANNDASSTQRRLYFDLNLLSTLPSDQNQSGGSFLASQLDPWKQLASAIIDFCYGGKG
ncbi:MAG: hypothetical protein SGILL_001324 [Bacillariaceae sp.]